MILRDVYQAISNMQTGDVKCRNLDEIQLQVKATDCPIRLLLPSTEGEQEFFGIGTLTKVTWKIRDLCLWQPILAGTGIEQCAGDMLAFIELYGAAIRALRNPVTGATIVGVSYKITPIAWATTDFWAVDTNLTVEEYDP